MTWLSPSTPHLHLRTITPTPLTLVAKHSLNILMGQAMTYFFSLKSKDKDRKIGN